MLDEYAFVICESVLIVAPFICIWDLFRLRRLSVNLRLQLIVALCCLIVLGIVCVGTNWSVRGIPDWIIGLVAYLAFVILATAARLWLRSRGWRYSVLGFSLILMVFAACVYPITFLEDYRQHGNVRMSAAYRFSAEWYGGAWSRHDGAWLSLYRTYWWLPFMEKRVWSGRFQDDDCEFTRLSERWSMDRHSLIVNCPGLKSEVVLPIN